MSRQRRNFSAKFKSDLVIELLKGEKDLNTLAAENNIQPNLLRNWKKEFLSNAAVVFVYCILKIPTIAEGNPKSCMRNFPIIADALVFL